MKKFLLIASSLLTLAACDSMQCNDKNGPTQTIKIMTTPEAANCAIDIDRMTVDRPENTPVEAKVQKNGKDLTIRCIKTGYKQAKIVLKPKADKSYDSTVKLTLAKK